MQRFLLINNLFMQLMVNMVVTGSGYSLMANPLTLPRNPLALLMLRDNKSNVNRVIGNVQIDYKMHFLPDLHLLLNLGIDNASGKMITLFIDSIIKLVAQFTTNRKRKIHWVMYELFYTKELKQLKSKFDVLVGHS